MDPEQFRGHEARRIRVVLLGDLAESLERAYAAVVSSDLLEFTRQTGCQRALCGRLRLLPAEPAQSPQSGVPGILPAPISQGARALGEELAEVERTVARLNCRYAALLRRARRTVDIFCRVLANSALTYPPPRPAVVRFAAGFQE
ncbi:MAG: hypothetical protein WB952_12565 [Terriglobales bacterium]